MSNLPTLQSTNTKIKSFWERPEGNTGLVFLGLGALAVFSLGKMFLPDIINFLNLAITAVGKGMVLGALCGIIALLYTVVMNDRFRTVCSFLFKSSMRKLTSIVIETDPIGIMKSYIETLIEKKSNFDSNKTSLMGQIRLCSEQIAAINQEVERDRRKAEAANKAGNEGSLRVAGRNMERGKEQVDRMQKTLSKMEMLYKFLMKYSEATDLVIQDMQNEVKSRERDLKFSTTANNAMRSAWGILKGEGVGREMYDEAMEFALADFANKMGEIDDFMISTQSIMDGIDLQNGIWEQAALEQLNSFESKTDSLLLGSEKRLMLENASMSVPINTDVREPVTIEATNYSRFLK